MAARAFFHGRTSATSLAMSDLACAKAPDWLLRGMPHIIPESRLDTKLIERVHHDDTAAFKHEAVAGFRQALCHRSIYTIGSLLIQAASYARARHHG